MSATPTPGPWTVSALDGRTCGPSRLLVLGGGEVPQLQAVAIVTLRAGETAANARLIAAAPTMLAALYKAVETIHALHGDIAWSEYQHSPEMKQITAAIKEATDASR